jgi:hypothetical protein
MSLQGLQSDAQDPQADVNLPSIVVQLHQCCQKHVLGSTVFGGSILPLHGVTWQPTSCVDRDNGTTFMIHVFVATMTLFLPILVHL